MIQKKPWWQNEILYQIYPLSFQDSNGDGYGDLRGITSRLSHIKQLGVKGIWLSPIYESPLVDLGYDISDYTAVHHLMGSMDDFQDLLSEAHSLDLKVILDLVPNHTSDQHPWFVESRSSRKNRMRDWYLWQDPSPDGGPPNNWQSSFGGSAWQFDEVTGQYYYHAFMKEQPDLNWRNPWVRSAIFEAMRFWLDKGVDGFRVDVMWHLIKDKLYRDNPPNPLYVPGQSSYALFLPVFSANQPEVHEVVAMMRAVMYEYDDRLLLGELYLPTNKIADYYGMDGTGADLPMNCLLMVQDWKAPTIFAHICEYEGSLPPYAWPNWVIGNHDHPRVATRLGTDQAKVAALLLLTLKGTPIIYYGDEIGMLDLPISGEGSKDLSGELRDRQRSPMPWDDGPNAGFSHGTPWLALNGWHKQRNVKLEEQDPCSMLHFYRNLIYLRTSEEALHSGDFVPAAVGESAFAFIRETGNGSKRFLIAVNLSDKKTALQLSNRFEFGGRVVVSTLGGLNGREVGRTIDLQGNEGLVAVLQ